MAKRLSSQNRFRRFARLAGTGMALAVGACGGGGGGSGIISTPTPTPTPSQPGYIKVFPNITQSTDFAVIGTQTNAFNLPASALVTNGFAVSFDAVSGAYVIDLPSADPGPFFAYGESSATWNGFVQGSWFDVSLLKPSPANPVIQLSHTSYGQFFEYDYDDWAPAGFIAFGTATPEGSVPTTGSATMDAIVRGLTLDGDGAVDGTATLQFDFGAGTLAGQFNPVLLPYSGGQFALGQYTFVDTVFGVGNTTFSGNFAHANPLLTGAFNGLFTGPNAQELMASWSASYFVQGVTPEPEEMFGIWVGKGP